MIHRANGKSKITGATVNRLCGMPDGELPSAVRWRRDVENWIAGHPVATIAAAFTAGAALGWLVKRR